MKQLERIGGMACVLVVALASSPGRAQSPEAQAAYSEALSLMRVEADDDALGALDRAIAAAPTWTRPFAARAELRARKLTSAVAAAQRFDAAYDYPAAISLGEAALADLEKGLGLPLDVPDEATRQATLKRQTDLKRLVLELRRQHTTGRDEARLAAEAESARRASEARAAQFAQQQQLQRQYEAQVEAAAPRRRLAYVFGAGAAVSLVASLSLFVGSQVVIGDIQAGRLATGALVEEAARSAGGLQTGALLLGVAGLALLGTSGYFFFASRAPDAPPPLTLSWSVSPGGLALSARW